MYVRKYAPREEARGEAPLNIPENYAGNAFKQTEEPTAPCPAPKDERQEEKPGHVTQEKPCAAKGTELLPILLSVLLSENKEHEDIAAILLFLLLL